MKRKILSLILALVLLLSVVPAVSAFTYSGECGENLTWVLDTESGVLTITGTGPLDQWEHDKENTPWYSYRSSIKTVNIGDGVTLIGRYAFQSCKNLAAVSIPDSVTVIRDGAFSYCEQLRNIAVPDTVTRIERYAFYVTGDYNDASKWTNGAFYLGKHLIEVEDTVKGAYSVREGTKTIADDAFSYSKGLSSVTIPDSVLYIWDNVFTGCENLVRVTLGNGVISIGSEAFSWLAHLTEVTLGSGLKRIGDHAFEGCVQLVNVILPDGVESVGEFAFSGCRSLKSLSVPGSMEAIDPNAFEGCGIQSLVLGDVVKTVGDAAFLYCSNLTDVTISKSVTGIGEAAFRECEAITNVNFLGTKEEWDAITIEEGNECLTRVSVQFAEAGCEHAHTHPEHKDPTCTEPGYDGIFCDDCGKMISATTIPALGHNYVDGVCTRCGAEEPVLPDPNTFCGAEGDGSNLTWKLDAETGVLTIEGSGAMRNYSQNAFKTSPWYYQRDSIKRVELPDGITEIGEYAFWLCSNLESVDLPNGLRRIGMFAFSGTGLTAIDVPQSVEIIGAKAFDHCEKLATVSLPDTLKELGTEAFQFTALYNAQISEESNDVYVDNYLVKAPNAVAVDGLFMPLTYHVKEGTIGIASNAFGTYSDVETAYIPSSVRMFSPRAFNDHDLVNVYVADGIEEIGSFVFYGPRLKHVELPASVKKIGAYAFAGTKDTTSGRIISELCFFGAAPEVEKKAFLHENGKTAVGTVYFLSGQEGWTYPSWNGVGGRWWNGEKVIYNHCADVDFGSWYIRAVDFVIGTGLMNGVSEESFAPNEPMTRAMLVTVLWRYEGKPEAKPSSFSDLTAGWYKDAVAWAAENGIVTGVGDKKFDPNGNITREQMAAILYRYAQKKELDTTGSNDLKGFPDADKVSGWAKDAIAWTVAEGIINGNGGKLDPQGNATRAQVATILMRFIEGTAKK